ncbi:MAG: hypothetical protein KIS94_11165 [Chitinophagales bacterium]|nr:hypothetical protein [Chitinophagales bacterium]
MKKLYTLLSAAILLSFNTQAKTYTLGSGKWNDANTWNGDYAGNTVKAGDVVIITGQVTVTNPVLVEGVLKVEKGASMVGMKDLVVTKNGTFVNNGNTVMKRIINEGTIENNLIMEAMLDIENRGSMDNSSNVVAGNNMQNYGGNAKGNGGAYFINNNITTSPSAKFGSDVKVFYGNAIENSNTAEVSALGLEATISENSVVLNVTNPSKIAVSLFSIEKSHDGKSFTLVDMISKVNNDSDVAMNYTDTKINSNLTYYRVKAINTAGEETVLPIATVKVPFGEMWSMAK